MTSEGEHEMVVVVGFTEVTPTLVVAELDACVESPP